MRPPENVTRHLRPGAPNTGTQEQNAKVAYSIRPRPEGKANHVPKRSSSSFLYRVYGWNSVHLDSFLYARPGSPGFRSNVSVVDRVGIDGVRRCDRR